MAARHMLEIRTNENLKLKNLAEKYGYCYIDVNDRIKDVDGRL